MDSELLLLRQSGDSMVAAFLVVSHIDNGRYGLPDNLESRPYYRRLCFLNLHQDFMQVADGTGWVEDMKWRENHPMIVAKGLTEKPWRMGTFHIL
jgi:hypothetical protein